MDTAILTHLAKKTGKRNVHLALRGTLHVRHASPFDTITVHCGADKPHWHVQKLGQVDLPSPPKNLGGDATAGVPPSALQNTYLQVLGSVLRNTWAPLWLSFFSKRAKPIW